MKQTMTAPRNETPKAPPLCRTVPLRRLPNAPRRELAYCTVPERDSAEALIQAFQAAPQFSQISLETLIGRKGDSGFRVVLLGENDYYLRQAAVYLTALSRKGRKGRTAPAADSYWDDFDLDDIDLEEGDSPARAVKNALVVVSPALLDSSIGQSTPFPGKPGAIAQARAEAKQLDLTGLESAGVLIAAESGPVLSEGVIDKVDAFLEQEDPQDIFVAVKSSQTDLELLEELRFTYGFQACRVGQADQSYLRRLLAHMAEDSLLTLSPATDLDKAIAQLRRYRGAAFQESDLELLLRRAAQRKGRKPLETADLLFRPYRSQSVQGREALKAMVGLDGVKDALDRLLSAAAMEDRRRLSGVEIAPSCRNMAFSGPPGTGKSVTARLAAQILREEGCGTGRFVEAGREQLIGSFLGQTSPMIAELFHQARGGVLFIDEAGALIDKDGQDIYVTEAVNALVRHMELEPETMVIFATYPEEMKKLLSSNPGLSSRVAQVLEFPGYEDSQLFEIFRTFADKECLTLPEDAADICSRFFSTLRRRKGDDFGNGREARRLFQAAKEEMALRTINAAEVPSALAAADMTAAARRLLTQEKGPGQSAIGFRS